MNVSIASNWLIVWLMAGILLFVTSCTSSGPEEEVPALSEYCLVAQKIVTQTDQPMNLTIHEDFDGFVKSKAIIPEGDNVIPEIQQFQWTDETGRVVGVSCKLKSADHLNLVYGDGTAGPDGACQDMNQFVYAALNVPDDQQAFPAVRFDPREEPQTENVTPVEGGSGPQWLQEYTATVVDADGALVIKTKGFIVDFTDPQFAQAPARFRGVHYCHFLAPDYFRALLTGAVPAGTEIGQTVDLSKYSVPGQ